MSQGALQGLGPNKSYSAKLVRGAGIGQQAVDKLQSVRLSPPEWSPHHEQQDLLYRLGAVRLGADQMACKLESPDTQQVT